MQTEADVIMRCLLYSLLVVHLVSAPEQMLLPPALSRVVMQRRNALWDLMTDIFLANMSGQVLP